MSWLEHQAPAVALWAGHRTGRVNLPIAMRRRAGPSSALTSSRRSGWSR